MVSSMKQKFSGVEAASMEQAPHNPSMVQKSAISEVHPHHVVVDKELHDQIVTSLTKQISDLIKHMKSPEKENNEKKEGALVVPPISTVGAGDVGASINKRKRGQSPDNKPYGETIGTLQLPKNCIPNNIDLDNVQLLTQPGSETSIANKNPNFSVTERLKDWKIKHEIQNGGVADDIYYYHSHSNMIFRSKLEVIQFVLTETFTKEPASSSKMETWSHEPKIDIGTKTLGTSGNKRMKVENVESEHLVEPILSECLVEDAIRDHIVEDTIRDHIVEDTISEQVVGATISIHMIKAGVNDDVVESSVIEHVAKSAMSNQLVEAIVSNQLADAAVGNQDPKLTSNASDTSIYPNEEIYELMSTEEMLEEFEIAFQRGEIQ